MDHSARATPWVAIASSARTPILYHASPNGPHEDGMIQPRTSRTCVHHEYVPDDHPRRPNHEGDFVFATSDLATAYAYAFKLHDPSRQEFGLKYRSYLVGGINPVRLADGTTVPVAVISERERFLEQLKTAQPVIYTLPPTRFRQVHSRAGRGMGEYVSRGPIMLDECDTYQGVTMEEAMKQGVQFFFLKDGVSKEDYREDLKDAYNAIGRHLPGETHSRLANGHFVDFLRKEMKDGVIEHYNADPKKGIGPVNWETMELPQPIATKAAKAR